MFSHDSTNRTKIFFFFLLIFTFYCKYLIYKKKNIYINLRNKTVAYLIFNRIDGFVGV